jgi:hypothetical protein
LMLSYVYRFVIVVNESVYNDYILFTNLHFYFFYTSSLKNLSNSYTLRVVRYITSLTSKIRE